MLRSLSALISWLLRAWPILSLGPIALAHVCAHRLFPADLVLVNKITGAVLQLVGGLIVLHSVNGNLGLFRDQHFGNIILGWFRSFPLFRKSVTVSLSGAACATASGSARISVRRAASTVEEKIAELERQLEEFRQHVSEDLRAANARIAQVHSELSTAIAAKTTILNQLSSKLELATVGGFKQQSFGVLLAIYGAVTSVFA
jgi:hypothetical protein